MSHKFTENLMQLTLEKVQNIPLEESLAPCHTIRPYIVCVLMQCIMMKLHLQPHGQQMHALSKWLTVLFVSEELINVSNLIILFSEQLHEY